MMSSVLRGSGSGSRRAPLGTVVSIFAAGSPVELTARRTYVHAFLRMPSRATIPSFATHRHCPMRGCVADSDMNSTPIDRDLFEQQFDRMYKVLSECSLIDSIHMLPPVGYFEATRVADLMTSQAEQMIPMPMNGMEHRQTELTETIRFVRMLGSPSGTVDILQRDDQIRACGSDFVLLPSGFVAAVTPRTNNYAVGVMQGSYAVKEDTKVFPTVACNLKDMQLPLMDIVGFGGQSTIVVWDTPEGVEATNAISQKGSRPWHFVKVEPGCYFVTFSGGLPRYDCIVDADFPRSTERLQKAGLRVLPIDWSEPKKLGLGMRPCILVLLFAKGGFSGGGMFTHSTVRSSRDMDPTKMGLKNNQKRSAAEGAPLYGQLISGELPPPVYQPKPRYAPPMHRKGVPAVVQEEWDEEWRRKQSEQTILEKTGGYDWDKEGAEKYQFTDVQEDGRRFRPGWQWK